MNKKIIIFVCAVLLIIPLALNFLIQIPAFFPIIGEPVNWLMFWATYLGAASSFVMIVYTSLTLKQNKEQLQELKKQWEEEHKPDITVHFFNYDQFFYIRIKNISKVTVSNISITVTRDPETGIIWNYDNWKQNIENLHFSIEPNGHRDIEAMGSCYKGMRYDDTLGLRFDFNDHYSQIIDLSFDEASLLNHRLEEQALLNALEKVASEIEKKHL